jgi:ABC-type glycerol-3-phosphate transport system substrate-binding protein
MSKFQIFVVGIFVVFIVAGVIIFATYKNKNTDTALPAVTIWGTFPADAINGLVTELNKTRTSSLVVNYVQKDETNFDNDFIQALARGQGPDAILVPQDMLMKHEDKLVAIPDTVLTERDFKDRYIPQAELYFNKDRQILALPLTIDPLMMYWNRSIFTSAGIATYPKSWDEFSKIIPKINQKDANANIRRSAIAMGEFVNINNARELLGILLIQAGNPITTYGDASSGSRLVSTLGDGEFLGTKYSTPAVTFYTQFSNPRDPYYSWNRSLPMSKSLFLSGSLATYFGFASEYSDLRAKNQNLDFDVAPLPQAKGEQGRATYGKMYGFSIVRSTPSAQNTYNVISALSDPQAISFINKITGLPPVRRDMIATGSKDPYQSLFYDSALVSRSWLDVDPKATSQIFQTMIESITSGRADVYTAIQTAHTALDLSLLNK